MLFAGIASRSFCLARYLRVHLIEHVSPALAKQCECYCKRCLLLLLPPPSSLSSVQPPLLPVLSYYNYIVVILATLSLIPPTTKNPHNQHYNNAYSLLTNWNYTPLRSIRKKMKRRENHHPFPMRSRTIVIVITLKPYWGICREKATAAAHGDCNRQDNRMNKNKSTHERNNGKKTHEKIPMTIKIQTRSQKLKN